MTPFDSQFTSYDDSVSKNQPVYSGKLGITLDGSRQVNVQGRGGFVYIRLRDNLSEVIQAYNDKVSPVYDFPVLFQRKGNRWFVLGKDTARYDTWSTYAPFLPAHGNQHSFNRDTGDGGDKVDIYPDQFMPLLVYPSGTSGAGMLMVAPYMLQRPTDFIYVGNTGTQNLLVYKPTTNQAILGLVVLNKNTGNPEVLINSGTTFAASITGSAGLAQYIPYPQSHQEPLYAFRLVSGTIALGWSNLYNARQLIGGSTSTGTSSSGGGISGIVAQDEGVTLGTGTVFNFVGANVDASISGSVVRVFVTGSSGGGVPSFITGSIPYAKSDGTLKESNQEIWFDDTLKTLWLKGGGFSPLQNSQVGLVIMPTGTNTSSVMGMAAFGTGTLGSPSATINGYRARGTLLSPTPVQSGDALQTVIGNGYDGATWQNAARLRFYADGNWVTGTYYPTRIDFDVTPSGSSTRRTELSIYGNGTDIPTGSLYMRGGTAIPHEVIAGSNISIDASNPSRPIISSTASGGREVLLANRTYYVRTGGSNSNNGLTNTDGGAFLTIQKAVDTVAGLDLSVYDATIQIASGTYTNQVIVSKPFVGAGNVIIQGNSAAPATVYINATPTSVLDGSIVVQNGAVVTIKDLKIKANTIGNCLYAQNYSTVNLYNIVFDAAVDNQIFATASSTVWCQSNYYIVGAAKRHYFSTSHAAIIGTGLTITLIGTLAFSSQFAGGSILGLVSNYSSTFVTGSATGQRYNASTNSVIYTNGGGANYFPGNSAGATATGGQYI